MKLILYDKTGKTFAQKHLPAFSKLFKEVPAEQPMDDTAEISHPLLFNRRGINAGIDRMMDKDEQKKVLEAVLDALEHPHPTVVDNAWEIIWYQLAVEWGRHDVIAQGMCALMKHERKDVRRRAVRCLAYLADRGMPLGGGVADAVQIWAEETDARSKKDAMKIILSTGKNDAKTQEAVLGRIMHLLTEADEGNMRDIVDIVMKLEADIDIEMLLPKVAEMARGKGPERLIGIQIIREAKKTDMRPLADLMVGLYTQLPKGDPDREEPFIREGLTNLCRNCGKNAKSMADLEDAVKWIFEWQAGKFFSDGLEGNFTYYIEMAGALGESLNRIALDMERLG
ncbi:MAG: hypothetical protein ACP5NX_02530 [Candidatus Bilamarchaeaceae archaeon]